mmetsp:Transcript_33342/g.105681  ORF Transcript_33342/g.105681 Transcript_33342/m.105681 type:complete len:473 (-) Transcript_33342:12-1430(-)
MPSRNSSTKSLRRSVRSSRILDVYAFLLVPSGARSTPSRHTQRGSNSGRTFLWMNLRTCSLPRPCAMSTMKGGPSGYSNATRGTQMWISIFERMALATSSGRALSTWRLYSPWSRTALSASAAASAALRRQASRSSVSRRRSCCADSSRPSSSIARSAMRASSARTRASPERSAASWAARALRFSSSRARRSSDASMELLRREASRGASTVPRSVHRAACASPKARASCASRCNASCPRAAASNSACCSLSNACNRAISARRRSFSSASASRCLRKCFRLASVTPLGSSWAGAVASSCPISAGVASPCASPPSASTPAGASGGLASVLRVLGRTGLLLPNVSDVCQCSEAGGGLSPENSMPVLRLPPARGPAGGRPATLHAPTEEARAKGGLDADIPSVSNVRACDIDPVTPGGITRWPSEPAGDVAVNTAGLGLLESRWAVAALPAWACLEKAVMASTAGEGAVPQPATAA